MLEVPTGEAAAGTYSIALSTVRRWMNASKEWVVRTVPVVPKGVGLIAEEVSVTADKPITINSDGRVWYSQWRSYPNRARDEP